MGPLLYTLIHINELPTVIHRCKVALYAGDTLLTYTHKNVNQIKELLGNVPWNIAEYSSETKTSHKCKKDNIFIFRYKTKVINIKISSVQVNY